MIKIYLMKTEEFLEESKFLQGCKRIDDTRLEKVRACKSTEDKVRSLCCGLLLQYALKRELNGVEHEENIPLELVYGIGEQGKPYLKDYPELYFNLSHSGEYVALAVSDREVGIDVQEKRSVKENMAKRVLAQQEYEQYQVLREQGAESFQVQEKVADMAQDWFFRCWCAKESYGKLTGKGLLLDPGTIVYIPEKSMIEAETAYKERKTDKERKKAFCREYTIAHNEYYLNACVYEQEEFPEEVTYVTFAHIIS